MKSLALACSLPSAPSSLPPLIVGTIWFYSRVVWTCPPPWSHRERTHLWSALYLLLDRAGHDVGDTGRLGQSRTVLLCGWFRVLGKNSRTGLSVDTCVCALG